MSLSEKENTVRSLGPDAAEFLKLLRQSRNEQIQSIDSGKSPLAAFQPDADIKEEWKRIIIRHYEELLDVFLKLAKRKQQSSAPQVRDNPQPSL
jgi:hypothetical protein